MRKNDFKAIDLLLAMVLLTRLPLPICPKPLCTAVARGLAFPLAGAVVGLLAVITAALALMWWPR